MPSTHLSLHYHFVFSTKNRERWIHDAWRDRLHAFLGGAVRALNGIPEQIGGVDDHVHLLAGLRATHCVADVMRDVKSGSSEWVHNELHVPQFEWQEGYGAFTVSASKRDEVKRYIQNQAEHHRSRTFKDEYVALLEKSGVEYDETYLW